MTLDSKQSKKLEKFLVKDVDYEDEYLKIQSLDRVLLPRNIFKRWFWIIWNCWICRRCININKIRKFDDILKEIEEFDCSAPTKKKEVTE